MSGDDLLAWAERWHYPFLRLGSKDAVRHGRQHWAELATSKDAVRRILAEQRIERWNIRAEAREGEEDL